MQRQGIIVCCMHDMHELGWKMSECHGSGTEENALSLSLTCPYLTPYIPTALEAELAKVLLISKHASGSS